MPSGSATPRLTGGWLLPLPGGARGGTPEAFSRRLGTLFPRQTPGPPPSSPTASCSPSADARGQERRVRRRAPVRTDGPKYLQLPGEPGIFHEHETAVRPAPRPPRP
ncbi:MAG: hypothetical protein MZU95_08440 [Desulfomicrobium escambiense]|nr:hypothetical protein [Desulfomicrobium escambiense]